MIDRYIRQQMQDTWSELRTYDNWLAVELAVCEAWTAEGVIPKKDMVKLRRASYDLPRIKEVFRTTKHDMTAFIRSITERLGSEGRWIHLGVTSYDIQDTAQALQLVESVDILIADARAVLAALNEQAVKQKHTVMIGRTHGIHAEPTTFGLKLALWWDEMRRNLHRLEEARQVIAVGKISGAVGTHATVPPSIEEHVCKYLGLAVAPLSSQILQRDRHAQLITTLALVGASIEKFATEIRHLQRTEVREVEEPFDEGQTGSSAMPHKRNPELTERLCGLARLLRGHAVTSLENVSLWHERDISHSSAERLILPDACYTLDYMLSLFTDVMLKLRIFPDRMAKNLTLTRGLIFSQRVMLTLIERGMSREKAYKIIQQHARHTWDEDLDFQTLLSEDPEVTQVLPATLLTELFDYNYYTRFTNAQFDRLGLTS